MQLFWWINYEGITVIYIYIDSCRIHTGVITKQRTQEDFFINICTSHFIARVAQGLRVRGCWRPNRTEIFCPPLLWPSTLCLSCSPDAQPEALGSTLLGGGFLYSILSASSLDPNSIRAPEGPFGLVWLSLPQLVPLPLQLYCNCPLNSTVLTSVLTSVLTELYNSSTATRFLKSHI